MQAWFSTAGEELQEIGVLINGLMKLCRCGNCAHGGELLLKAERDRPLDGDGRQATVPA